MSFTLIEQATPRLHRSELAVPGSAPGMFEKAGHVLMTKTDLLEYVPFNIHTAMANARAVNPSLAFFTVSSLNAWGLQDWFNFLRRSVGAPELAAR